MLYVLQRHIYTRAIIGCVCFYNTDKLVANNPDLRELEILGVDVTSVIHQNKFIKPKNHKAFDAW